MTIVKRNDVDSDAPDSGKAEGGGFMARAWARLAGKGPGTEQTRAHVVSPEVKALIVRYVESLLIRLIQRQETATALRAADSLPDVGVPVDPSLTYTKVVNRLKVLAGLYPVDYPKATEGHFRYEWQGRFYEVRIAFEDHGPASVCRITLSGPTGHP